jgi:TP901 family phage tail tape measure protein
MADLEKTVSIIFAGVDNISATASKINQSFSQLGGSIGAVADPLAGIAESVLKAEAALAALAVGGLALSVKSAGEFQSSFNEVNTMAGTTGASMEQFKQDILDYATGSTQSLESITTATYNAISMGVSWENSLATLSSAEKLAVAGKAELNSTLELLVGTMNAYGASSDQTADYANAFFTIVKDGKTTIPELAASLANVSGIAASSGVDIQTLGASLAAVTAAGTPTSQAITGVKAAIENIIKPSSQATEMAKSLGIQFNAAALESLGFDGMMKLIYESTGGNIAQMGKLFGSVEGLNTALILGADKSGMFAKSLEDMSKSTGAVDAAFEIMKNNVGLSLTNLMNNMQAVLIGAGTPLLSEFGESVKSLSTVMQGVKIGIDNGAFDPFFAAINDAQNELQEWLNGVAEAVPEAMAGVDFSGLISEIKGFGTELGEAFEMLFGNFDLTKPEELEAAIQKVIDVIKNLTATASGVLNGMSPLFSAIGIGIEKFAAMDTETAKLLGTVSGAGKTISEFVNALQKIGPALDVLTYGTIITATTNVISLLFALGGLGAIAIPAGIAVSLAALGWEAAKIYEGIQSLNKELKEVPEVVDTKIVISGGDEMDVVTGYIYSLDGKTVDVPVSLTLQNGDTINTVTGFITDANGKEVLVNSSVTLQNGDVLDLIGGFITEASSGKTYNLDTKLTFDKTDNSGLYDALNTSEANISVKYELNAETGKFEAVISEIGASTEAALNENVKAPVTETLEWIDEEGNKHELKVPVDNTGIEKTKSAIEAIPTEKMIEIKLQGEIDTKLATIKANAETVQTAMEWTAKLEIAQVEAGVKNLENMLKSVDNTISTTGETIASLFGTLSDEGLSQLDKWHIEDAAEEQQKMQQEAFELQKKILEQQIELNKEKLNKLKNGKSLISISADGLEPELEAFMWKIIERVQIQATEEASEMLLGI